MIGAIIYAKMEYEVAIYRAFELIAIYPHIFMTRKRSMNGIMIFTTLWCEVGANVTHWKLLGSIILTKNTTVIFFYTFGSQYLAHQQKPHQDSGRYDLVPCST